MRRNIKLKRKIVLNIKAGILLVLISIALSNLTPNHQINFQGLSQAEIPTGCESVSMVAILNHLGIEITPEHFIEEYLPKQKFYRSNGKLYGPDPN